MKISLIYNIICLCCLCSLCTCSELKFRDCLRNSDFQNLIFKGLTKKFFEDNFWKNDFMIRDQFEQFIKNISGHPYKLETIYDLIIGDEGNPSKNNQFVKKSYYLPEFMLSSQMINTYRYTYDDIISKSSEMFEEWLTNLSMSFKNWFDIYFRKWFTYLSDKGLKEIFRIFKCLNKYQEEDFEDNLKWLACFYICQDLRNISIEFEVIFDMIPQCKGSEWLGDLLLRVFMDFVHLDGCYFEIITPQNYMVLKEGDLKKRHLKFQTFVSPGVHCFPKNVFRQKKKVIKEVIKYVFGLRSYCRVKVELSTSNYLKDSMPPVKFPSPGTPKCRNGTRIIQIAMAYHPDGIRDTSACIELTKSNWNKTFVIPLVAVVDHRFEPELSTVNLTIKMVVDNKRLNTTKFGLKIIDGDSKNIAVCQSVNDPHLVTFDNVYYNNLEQGYFLLYRNKELPYEVQAIYQSCGLFAKGESCNCAIAVKSHDDVFVVDRCRLRSNESSGEPTRIMKVLLFTNGNLTNGTRIFRKHGGLTHQVLLPHGTLITIKVNGLNFLNVWISPSPYDRNRTIGLCGTYNDKPDDDLEHSDGSISAISKVRRFPPSDFIDSWRVRPNDRIFFGVDASLDESTLSETCRCSHQLLKNISCKCGFDQFVETCTLELGSELSILNISMISRKSEKTSKENETVYDPRDIDEAFVSVMNFTGGKVSQRKYCSSLLINNSKSIKFCVLLSSINNYTKGPVSNAIEGCIDDIKITGNQKELSNEWKMSALDAAKETCSIVMFKNPYFILEKMGNIFENETCANNCFMRGTCIEDVCHCDLGFYGPDCSFNERFGDQPFIFAETTYCDSRLENCSFIQFFGKGFHDEFFLECIARPIKATDLDQTELEKGRILDTFFVSPNQGACLMPNYSQKNLNSQEITIKVKNRNESAIYTFNFLIYDSACMTCDRTKESCVLKSSADYCLIDTICYKDLENTDEHCFICNVSLSRNMLTFSHDLNCTSERARKDHLKRERQRFLMIRLTVTLIFSIIVVGVTAIIFIKDKKKRIKQQEDKVSVCAENTGKRDHPHNLHSISLTHEGKTENLIHGGIESVGINNKVQQSKSFENEIKKRSMSANFTSNFHHNEARQRTLSETYWLSGGPILFGYQKNVSLTYTRKI